eukprot:988109_1
MGAITVCIHPELNWIPTEVDGYFHTLQYRIQIAIFWYRLVTVFDSSAYAVSKCMKSTFWTAYSAAFIGGILGIFLFGRETMFKDTLSIVMPAIVTLLSVLLVVMIIGSFIYKLVTISRKTESDGNQRMMALVSKLFLLTMLSLLTSLLAVMSGVIIFFFSCDVFTNFAGILFGFKAFEPVYKKLCGTCHNKCVKCWMKGDKIELKLAQEVTDASSADNAIQIETETDVSSRVPSGTSGQSQTI